MAKQDEIELKLDVTAAAAEAIRCSPLLAAVPARVDRLAAIYFDTPEQALRGAGLSFRIRREDGRHVQTLKVTGGAAAGLFARQEWRREVAGTEPVIDDKVPLHAVLGSADRERIAAVFEIEVERRTSIVGHAGAVIEVAIDHGRAVTPDGVESFAEIELELCQGEPAALFDLARRMNEIAAVRCGILSKAERAYRLTERAAGDPARAELPGLAVDASAAEGFAAIASACLRQFRLNESLLMERPHAGALHQARVALRRLRSTIVMFRDMLGDGQGDFLKNELRWLAGELGTARALDVLIEDGDHVALRPGLVDARDAAYATALAALESPRARGLMIDLAEWIAIGDWRRAPADPASVTAPLVEVAADALDRLRRRIKRAGKLNHLDDDARHRVRIAAKKLRYASEYFGPLFTAKKAAKRYESFVAALEEMQDSLGRLNDMASAAGLLVRLGIVDRADPVDGKRRAELVRAASRAQQHLLETKPFWR
ncbi:Inorganic triphosphatase YgiF, contains CYTH and CHAD domains [Sphingomonas laterariae]|uniref:Inorganic triphosphatase YgiF, contains CYTH and CHAD domains n=1 Tax=Edaphosphingomonas laterariae TaxID=861865 RepID=A0A239GBQ6_9SPHN|nr:CHAD domain-containing protein [Sphingomonas laterariae]SNS65484.1 Inorganic triphosphatase YgiF, contains CYTH and CHAD domains [Sphingomonas laterariae]